MQLQPLDDLVRPSRTPTVTIVVLVIAILLVVFAMVRGCSCSRTEAAEEKPAEAAQEAAATADETVAAVPEADAPAAAAPAVETAPAAPQVRDLTPAEYRQAVDAAQRLQAEGKLYDARKTLLAVLPRAQAKQAAELETTLAKLADQIYFTQRPGPDKTEYVIQPGDSISAIASRFVCPKELIQKANNISDPRRIRPGQRLVFLDHPKFEITVSKSANTLVLTLNGEFFKRYVVSTGLHAKTPVGTFKVRDKIEKPDWWTDSGKVVPYGDPENILGTHWLALEATGETPRVSGYGIHGTWDEASLGKQASAGCVRMRNAEVEELFTLVPRGTPVRIVE